MGDLEKCFPVTPVSTTQYKFFSGALRKRKRPRPGDFDLRGDLLGDLRGDLRGDLLGDLRCARGDLRGEEDMARAIFLNKRDICLLLENTKPLCFLFICK